MAQVGGAWQRGPPHRGLVIAGPRAQLTSAGLQPEVGVVRHRGEAGRGGVGAQGEAGLHGCGRPRAQGVPLAGPGVRHAEPLLQRHAGLVPGLHLVHLVDVDLGRAGGHAVAARGGDGQRVTCNTLVTRASKESYPKVPKDFIITEKALEVAFSLIIQIRRLIVNGSTLVTLQPGAGSPLTWRQVAPGPVQAVPGPVLRGVPRRHRLGLDAGEVRAHAGPGGRRAAAGHGQLRDAAEGKYFYCFEIRVSLMTK